MFHSFLLLAPVGRSISCRRRVLAIVGVSIEEQSRQYGAPYHIIVAPAAA